MSILVRRLNDNDFFEWKPLFQQYAQFYGKPVPDDRALTLWGYLTDPTQNLFAFVAEQQISAEVVSLTGVRETMTKVNLVGFVHFCAVTRAIEADIQMQIQDHYVDPIVRRKGVARALVEAVKLDANSRGATSVAWAVATDNRVARNMSERLGRQTDWIVFETDA